MGGDAVVAVQRRDRVGVSAADRDECVDDRQAVTGTCEARFPRVRIVLTEVDDHLELRRAGEPPEQLRYLGVHDSAQVYRFPGGLVAIDPEPTSSIVISTDGAVVRATCVTDTATPELSCPAESRTPGGRRA